MAGQQPDAEQGGEHTAPATVGVPLLRVLSGDLVPNAGTVHLNGRRLASYGPRALAGRRAALSQSLNVAFPFTVAEIVRM